MEPRREDLAASYQASADVFQTMGDLTRSMRFLRQMHAIDRQLVAADPNNRMAGANLAWSDLGMAENLLDQNKAEEAMPLIRDGLALFEKASSSKGYWYAEEVGQSYSDLGRAYALLAQHAQSTVDPTRMWRNALSADEKALEVRSLVPSVLDSSGHNEVSDIRRQLAEAKSALSRLGVTTSTTQARNDNK